MGVASTLDLANLYSCFFEDRADIHSYSDIYFYERYINNYLSLVYAINK